MNSEKKVPDPFSSLTPFPHDTGGRSDNMKPPIHFCEEAFAHVAPLARTIGIVVAVLASGGCKGRAQSAYGWSSRVPGVVMPVKFLYMRSQGGNVLFMIVSTKAMVNIHYTGGVVTRVTIDGGQVELPRNDGYVYVVVDDKLIRTEVRADPLVQQYLRANGADVFPKIVLPEELASEIRHAAAREQKESEEAESG